MKYLLLLLSSFLLSVVSAKANYANFELNDCFNRLNSISQLPLNYSQLVCDPLKQRLVTFNIMNYSRGPQCKNTIVINGEDHTAQPRMRMAMYLAGKDFPIRLREDAWDFQKIEGAQTIQKKIDSYNQSNSSLEEDYIAWEAIKKYGFFSRLFKVPVGSPIEDFWDDPGIRIDVNKEGHFSANYHFGNKKESRQELLKFLKSTSHQNINSSNGVSSCSLYNLADVTQGRINLTSFLEINKDLIGTEGFPKITISAEFGELNHYNYNCEDFNSLTCKLYVLTARNRRFALNIKTVMDSLPCGISISLTVGYAHIEGISRNLENLGFTEADQNLSKYSYYNTPYPKADPEHAGRPNQN